MPTERALTLTWSHRSPPASLSSDGGAQLRLPRAGPGGPQQHVLPGHRCGHHRPRGQRGSVPPTGRVPECTHTEPGAGHEGGTHRDEAVGEAPWVPVNPGPGNPG